MFGPRENDEPHQLVIALIAVVSFTSAAGAMSLKLSSLRLGGMDEELADSVGLCSVLDLKVDVSKIGDSHASLAEVAKQVAINKALQEGKQVLGTPSSASADDSRASAFGRAAFPQDPMPTGVHEEPSTREAQAIAY